jgi:lipopolysaccharide transport system permease protein
MSVVESRSQINTPAPTAGVPFICIERSRGWFSLGLGELWAYRELLFFLVWRDIKVRYKQTAIGAAWAVLQPLMTMIVFTVLFKKIANVPSDGLPYPIFAYTALLPWNLFAGALTRSTTSLVGHSNLISKVYFPRLIVPLSATMSGLVDFAIAFVILIGMMGWYGIAPTWGVVWLPLFMLLALSAAFSVGLWLSALNVKYRDVGHAIPFFIQMFLFASPVAYSAKMIPDSWRLLYSLNPMVGVIEAFRWALLGKDQPDFTIVAISTAMVFVLLLAGLVFFKRTERTFADVV